MEMLWDSFLWCRYFFSAVKGYKLCGTRSDVLRAEVWALIIYFFCQNSAMLTLAGDHHVSELSPLSTKIKVTEQLSYHIHSADS